MTGTPPNRKTRRPAALFAVGAAVAVAWGALNWTGFCFDEFRYLSDQEFFERFLESNPHFLKPELWEVQNEFNDKSIRAVVPYGDAKEYLALFPDCCGYGPQSGVSPDMEQTPPSLPRRLLGRAWTLVAIHLNQKYVDGSGKEQSLRQFVQWEANSCGAWINPAD